MQLLPSVASKAAPYSADESPSARMYTESPASTAGRPCMQLQESV